MFKLRRLMRVWYLTVAGALVSWAEALREMRSLLNHLLRRLPQLRFSLRQQFRRNCADVERRPRRVFRDLPLHAPLSLRRAMGEWAEEGKTTGRGPRLTRAATGRRGARQDHLKTAEE